MANEQKDVRAVLERLRLAADTARENGTTWVSARDLTAALNEVERLQAKPMSDNPVRRQLDRQAIRKAAWNDAIEAAWEACQERADLIAEFEVECCQGAANLCAADVANLKKGADQ